MKKSNNPAGRPRKKRALATAIETVGYVKGDDGVVNKRRLAEVLWEVVTTRRYNDQPVPLQDWLELVKWMAQHLDGPVPQQVDVAQGGEIVLRVVYDNARQLHAVPGQIGAGNGAVHV